MRLHHGRKWQGRVGFLMKINILSPCGWCGHKIEKDPIVDYHQEKISIRCPYCLYRRGEWADTLEKAIENWNED